MDSSKRLKETHLSPKEAFYSKVNDKHISDEDYIHARDVWKKINMKTLGDYHN